MTKYTITDQNGNPISVLNKNLALRQQVSDQQLENLKALHAIKDELFRLMKLTSDPAELKAGAHFLEDLEFALQRNWNFSEDAGMHEWYKAPGCTCPKLDNADGRYPGATQRIYSGNCPIHGGF